MWFKVTPYLFLVFAFVALWGFGILDVVSGGFVAAVFLTFQILRLWTRPRSKP